MEGSPGPSRAGLRAFKKARTRAAISDVATRLFVEQGFERVTMAQIAEAADVSVKTVFNYFTSKEELFWDRADDVVESLVAAILERPAGVTALEALRRVLADRRVPFDPEGWAALRDVSALRQFRAFVATAEASPALRARQLLITESWADRLAAALAADLGRPREDPAIQALAGMVLAVIVLRDATMRAELRAEHDAARVERAVRAVVDEGFTRLARAFADLDRPRGADVAG